MNNHAHNSRSRRDGGSNQFRGNQHTAYRPRPLVSIANAWDEALANSGRVDKFHIPSPQERIQNHIKVIKEVQQMRHEEALNLLNL